MMYILNVIKERRLTRLAKDELSRKLNNKGTPDP